MGEREGTDPRSGRSPWAGGTGRRGTGEPATAGECRVCSTCCGGLEGDHEGRGCTGQGKSSLEKLQQNKAQKWIQWQWIQMKAETSVVLGGRTGSGREVRAFSAVASRRGRRGSSSLWPLPASPWHSPGPAPQLLAIVFCLQACARTGPSTSNAVPSVILCVKDETRCLQEVFPVSPRIRRASPVRPHSPCPPPSQLSSWDLIAWAPASPTSFYVWGRGLGLSVHCWTETA